MRAFIFEDGHTKYSVKNKAVCCGKSPEHGHPKVYLALSASKKSVSCPYCGAKFDCAENTHLKNH